MSACLLGLVGGINDDSLSESSVKVWETRRQSEQDRQTRRTDAIEHDDDGWITNGSFLEGVAGWLLAVQ